MAKKQKNTLNEDVDLLNDEDKASETPSTLVSPSPDATYQSGSQDGSKLSPNPAHFGFTSQRLVDSLPASGNLNVLYIVPIKNNGGIIGYTKWTWNLETRSWRRVYGSISDLLVKDGGRSTPVVVSNAPKQTPQVFNGKVIINGEIIYNGVPLPHYDGSDNNLNYMGEWVEGNEHYVNDLVVYNGEKYLCIQNILVSNAAPDMDTTHWLLVSDNNYPFVEIDDVPAAATQGTLSEDDLAKLLINERCYIIFNKEKYYLEDIEHTSGYITYSHVGYESGAHILKTITVTTSTGAWTLTSSTIGEPGAKLYCYQIVFGTPPTMIKFYSNNGNLTFSVVDDYLKYNNDDQSLIISAMSGSVVISTIVASVRFSAVTDGTKVGVYVIDSTTLEISLLDFTGLTITQTVTEL